MRSETLFRRADLILAIVVAGVIAGSMFYYSRSFRSRANRADCQGRLWGMAKAFQEFAAVEGALPMGLSTNKGGSREYGVEASFTYQHFNAIAPRLPGPAFLTCPNDNRIPLGGGAQDLATLRRGWALTNNANLSYFINLDARPAPNSFLLGDRNLWTNSVVLKISPDQKLRWFPGEGLHGPRGNIGYMDGHVELLDFAKLNEHARLPGNAGARLSIP